MPSGTLLRLCSKTEKLVKFVHLQAVNGLERKRVHPRSHDGNGPSYLRPVTQYVMCAHCAVLCTVRRH